MDIGDVGGVSSEESENERCNLKSLGNGPKKQEEISNYHIILNLWVKDLRTRRDLCSYYLKKRFIFEYYFLYFSRLYN